MPEIRDEMLIARYEFGPNTDVSDDMARVGGTLIEAAGFLYDPSLAVAVYRAMLLQLSFERDPDRYLAERDEVDPPLAGP
jgi:hypothetical protein